MPIEDTLFLELYQSYQPVVSNWSTTENQAQYYAGTKLSLFQNKTVENLWKNNSAYTPFQLAPLCIFCFGQSETLSAKKRRIVERTKKFFLYEVCVMVIIC